ncbi:MAG: 5-formyltetrahydrofolate cyclo-ligase [Clostridiales Family XIII bacterium]|nr:5-formyltetrahydrofolate cyclo-ligase [Clostridiales Family XIII bacterium]
MQLKETLREELAELRRQDAAEGAAVDRAIAEALIRSELYRDAATIFTYVGVGDEISTDPLIERALADGKRVCAPVVLGGGVMEAREIRSRGDLTRGAMNLIEPRGDRPLCEPADIDLVVVPCVSCDLRGNRLGRGGGYYDRYLKRFRPASATFVALCRERLLSQNLPRRPLDVRMGYYVTEAGFFAAIDA